MRQKLKSLRFRMLLPVVVMTLFVVILLTALFSRAYTNMILNQEQIVNEVDFATISHSITPLINSSINTVRNIMSDDRVAVYARFQFKSEAERIHARISCRDYLRGEITKNDGIFGLLFMRKNGSMFGTLPDVNLFLDNPKENPLPEGIKNQILNVPHGKTIWTGPVSGADLYGFENNRTPRNVMIAAWKSVDVSYGECYALMLMDESFFERRFTSLQDGKSTWHLFTEERKEIYHTGSGDCVSPERFISESNSGSIFRNEDGHPVISFSMRMTAPALTFVREVSMDEYMKVIHSVRGSVAILACVVFLIALSIYELWLKKFMHQFGTLLKGITRMGQSDSEPITSKASTISEFETMQHEINRTSLALNQQMDTIRMMTAEKERISTEMNFAKDIQASALPSRFPAFPERNEFDLYASMTPAKEVGGDYYDFFLIDSDHLALEIADVSGKGIPAALFMMVSKSLIKNQLMTGCDPATALKRANDQLCDGNTAMMFVTVWLAILEISTGKLLVCNAGHEKPAIRRSGKVFELLEYRHDVFIGVRNKSQYHIREFKIYPGDCLFVYTDGVPESKNAESEMFGEERMIETLNQHANEKPKELICHIHEAVDSFADNTEQFDDITMLCLKYYGTQSKE